MARCRSATSAIDLASSSSVSASSAFIFEVNSKHATPSPMSQSAAEPLRSRGAPARFTSASSSDAVGPFHRQVAAVDPELLQPAVLDAIEGPAPRQPQQFRHRPALGGQPIREPVGAELVDQLERPELPIVAEAHRLIDAPDGVADRRHQLGGVGQGLAEHRPGVAAGPVGMGHQRAQAAGPGGGDALGTGLDARAIGAGAEVDGLLDPRAVHLAQAVEAALALPADRALRDHPRDQGLLAAVGAQPVAGRQQPVHAGGDLRDQVDADQIEQPEHAGLGDAHRAAHARRRPPRRSGPARSPGRSPSAASRCRSGWR